MCIRDRRYAYLPHAETAVEAQVWLAATAFNQPLIPAWPTADGIHVQLPFDVPAGFHPFSASVDAPPLPGALSLIEAQSGFVADLYRRGDRIEALVLDPDPQTPVTLTIGARHLLLPRAALATTVVDLTLPH